MTQDNNFLGEIDLSGILPAICEAPLIEVTFDIDQNSILNVTAREKSTGKENKMTINHNIGLSMEEIERMVNEAEKYRADGEKQKNRPSAKNCLESYCVNMKKAAGDVLYKCNEINRWLDANPLAQKEEFEGKQKELEQACNPIIKKMLAASEGTGVPIPTIEEVD